MKSLKHRLINGTIWNTISQAGTVASNFALTFILARILGPEEFGLIGMATVITGFLGFFSEFGIIDSIVRKKNHDALDEHTAFWTGIAFSLLTYTAIYFASPLVASFYDTPELTRICRVSSLIFLIGAYGFIPVALEIKKVQYKTLTLLELASTILSGACAIAAAYNGLGVWALVIQLLMRKLATNAGYFLFIKWRPKLSFSRTRFRTMIGFSIHRTANNLITFLTENSDAILIGKMLGPAALGNYTMAFRLTRFPIQKFWSVFGRMLFPAFAEMQDDRSRLRRNYIKITLTGGLLLLPVVAALHYFTDTFVLWTVGEKWLPVSDLIKILSIYLLLYSFSLADEPLMILISLKFLNTIKIISISTFILLGIIILQKHPITTLANLYVTLYAIQMLVTKFRIYTLLNQPPPTQSQTLHQ
ncbi:lipopolysaccharide biosynthesis protein [Pelagicoccus enzymogenes]|uniref:lipopolysaccharide biosynthesis protein n=1 Tax=Pelagicoccus enzymogenes TaxID=2773457 RepID=UPI00280C8C49|nr:lipopolysaccharide biosynthesis protein [Pelagicoccus enzymogenes]MDQ8201097.1 lipopolysaccharide biosynthesis protein [Pelagicoccus enzymogenes]